MNAPLGIEEARRLMARVEAETKSAGARAAMPPLPLLRSAVAALAQNCEVVLMLMDSLGDTPGDEEEEKPSGPAMFGR